MALSEAGGEPRLPRAAGEVAVATEMLLMKAEQVSDDGGAPPDYA